MKVVILFLLFIVISGVPAIIKKFSLYIFFLALLGVTGNIALLI